MKNNSDNINNLPKTEFYTVRGYRLLEQNIKPMTSAMEDYLEMIYRNSEKSGFIRLNTLARLLHVKASSATKMVQKIAELGFLNYEKYGIIMLTKEGKELGKYLLKRHNILESFLRNLGIADKALLETELIEHNISKETLININLLNNFFMNNPLIKEKFEDFKRLYRDDNIL